MAPSASKKTASDFFIRSIHDALTSIITMMEDVKIYNKDIYIMYADFKGAFNAADHNIMFKHTR
jgi:hypothetical protein